MVDSEITIVGGGVIGLSIARILSQYGRSVILIERNKTFGMENSSRNSGVVHAGIYYGLKSLKRKFCVNGNQSLYDYANERNINYKKCGKLIVSSTEQESKKLKKIADNAEKSGVTLKYLNQKELKKVEPKLDSIEGLFSETSGIIDVYDLMLNFVADIESNLGIVSYGSSFSSSKFSENCIEYYINEDFKTKFKTKILINSGGLNSVNIAKRILGVNKKEIPKVKFVKGNYMKLIGDSPFRKLIYPIPNKYGLGIHSTINFDNQTIFGPDTIIVKNPDFNVSKNIKNYFYKEIFKYWEEVLDRELIEDFCGVRTKLTENDFDIRITKVGKDLKIINLYGIESPGITSSIEIAKYISEII